MAVRTGKIRIAEVNCANHPAVFRGKIVVLCFFGTGVHQMMRRFHCELTVGGSLGEVIYSFGSGAEISGNSCVIGAGSAAFVKLD